MKIYYIVNKWCEFYIKSISLYVIELTHLEIDLQEIYY
jgi:hypothetical protein